MRGEVAAVWPETWTSIWQPLIEHEDAKDDLFCELFHAAIDCSAFRPPPEPKIVGPGGELLVPADRWSQFLGNPMGALEAFKALDGSEFAGERGAVALLEAAFDVAEEQGGDALSNYYFGLLEAFIAKFSLRYALRRPCDLCPTLPGIFTGLMRELQVLSASDAHLQSLLQEFEAALRDLKSDRTDGRIKTCIQKQINFLEALARTHPGVNAGELGAQCHQLGCWPHNALRASLGNLYGFASDYPGIRHGGNPDGAIRAMELKDMLAVCVALAGFTPYLAHGLDSEDAYSGRAV